MTKIELKEARDRLRNKVIIDLAKTNPELSTHLLGSQNQKQNNSIANTANNNNVPFKTGTTKLPSFEVGQPEPEIFSVKTSIISQRQNLSKLNDIMLSKISENKINFSQVMDNCRRIIQDLKVFANTNPTKLNYSLLYNIYEMSKKLAGHHLIE